MDVKRQATQPPLIILLIDYFKGEFVAHKLVKVLVYGFETSFQTGSGFNPVYSKD